MSVACARCGGRLAEIDGMCPRCVARSLTDFFKSAAPASPVPDVEVPGYTLGPVLGRGGMGVVFRAVREADGSTCAVKVMPVRGGVELAERFRREAAALATLEHPHILRIFGSGVCSDGACFLAMEEATGGDLARRLEKGPLPAGVALRLFREIAAAIGEAHRCGLLHRDIKPANVLLAAEGDDAAALVADFSLAKLLDDGGPGHITLTMSTQVFGTPYYIPPEARRGGVVDARGDIFSLGVLLHEMLTGRLPIGQYVPASKVADIPAGVDRLIARCLQEAPAQRPASTAVLLSELERALHPPVARRIAIAAVCAIAVAAGLHALPKKQPAPEVPATGPFINSLGMKFVPVPGNRAWFSVWETRRSDLEAFWAARKLPRDGAQALWLHPPGNVTADHPANPVNFITASDFCLWLTEKERAEKIIGPNAVYRLPDDVEWSRAAGIGSEPGDSPEQRHLSGGDKGHAFYPWGRTWPPPGGGIEANFAGQESVNAPEKLPHRDAFPATAPVGSFAANAYGLHDLGGNVSEWVISPWNETSRERVIRGGSWNQGTPESLRLDARQHAHPGNAGTGVGFRIVLER